jgi:hypothetical protein
MFVKGKFGMKILRFWVEDTSPYGADYDSQQEKETKLLAVRIGAAGL